MSIRKEFGLKIRELRLEKNISQEKLAEKSQLHRTYISSIESGRRNISLLNIFRLAQALDCEIADFFPKKST
jgi:transcriptional regulator with XRE-family HTH domain